MNIFHFNNSKTNTMTTVNFFTPIVQTGGLRKTGYSDVYVVSYLSGNGRKNTSHNVYLTGLLKKISESWRYVKFGVDSSGQIILKKGSDGDYLITGKSGGTASVSNKDLVLRLFELSGRKIPKSPGESARIDFIAISTNGHYTLIKKSA